MTVNNALCDAIYRYVMELRVENLCYDYNKGTSFEKRALNNINLSIKEMNL